MGTAPLKPSISDNVRSNQIEQGTSTLPQTEGSYEGTETSAS